MLKFIRNLLSELSWNSVQLRWMVEISIKVNVIEQMHTSSTKNTSVTNSFGIQSTNGLYFCTKKSKSKYIIWEIWHQMKRQRCKLLCRYTCWSYFCESKYLTKPPLDQIQHANQLNQSRLYLSFLFMEFLQKEFGKSSMSSKESGTYMNGLWNESCVSVRRPNDAKQWRECTELWLHPRRHIQRTTYNAPIAENEWQRTTDFLLFAKPHSSHVKMSLSCIS